MWYYAGRMLAVTGSQFCSKFCKQNLSNPKKFDKKYIYDMYISQLGLPRIKNRFTMAKQEAPSSLNTHAHETLRHVD